MAEHVGINAIISKAVAVLRSDKVFGPQLSNTWLPAATFAKAIVKSGHVDDTLTIDAWKFNVAMSKSAAFGDVMTRFDGPKPYRCLPYLLCKAVLLLRYRFKEKSSLSEPVKWRLEGKSHSSRS